MSLLKHTCLLNVFKMQVIVTHYSMNPLTMFHENIMKIKHIEIQTKLISGTAHSILDVFKYGSLT